MSSVSRRPLALVTGGTAGLGREFCEQLAVRGYDLLIVGRDSSRLARVAGELREARGVSVEALPADLSTDDGVIRVAERIVASPRLSLLVNNAGFGTLGTLVEADPGQQAAMLRLHVLAPMRLCQAALPAMIAAGLGGIINVSSVASFLYSAANVNYCATKAYLTVFSEGLALETREAGVRVQALCPGFVRTEFHERARMDMRDIPGPLWLRADRVVRDSLQALERGRPVICVPGAQYRVAVALLRWVPRSWIGRLADRRRG